MIPYRLGWLPDRPDFRDHLLTFPFFRTLPPRADLRGGFPPVYDQGNLGSCTANAAAGGLQFLQRRQGLREIMPSRLFCYYHTRELESSIASDAGGTIRDTIKVCAKLGVPPETDWPYDIARFADEPTELAHADALNYQLLQYSRLPVSGRALRSALASGYPVVWGFSVYDSLLTPAVAATGVIPMPTEDETQVGGHAVVLVGYDDDTRTWMIRNSWGAGWGDAGYGWLPYDYLPLCQDPWVIRLTEGDRDAI